MAKKLCTKQNVGDSRTSILEAMQCKFEFEYVVVPITCRSSISKIQQKERL